MLTPPDGSGPFSADDFEVPAVRPDDIPGCPADDEATAASGDNARVKALPDDHLKGVPG